MTERNDDYGDRLDALGNVRAIACEWSRQAGEDAPAGYVALTTHDAIRMIIRNEPIPAVPNERFADPAYLVILTGKFTYQRGGTSSPLVGVWVAIMIKSQPWRLVGFSLKPEEYIPTVDLSPLGHLTPIAC